MGTGKTVEGSGQNQGLKGSIKRVREREGKKENSV